MIQKIYIFGTSHKYQRPDPTLEDKQVSRFENELKNICSDQSILVLAEENNIEAQSERCLEHSVPYNVSRAIGINHIYCDPDRSQRARIGIRQENDIRASCIMDDLGEEQIHSLNIKSFQLRECYWLNQIKMRDLWPVLLVCGSDHVGSVVKKAGNMGFSVEVLYENWPA